jgi:hypothetical protein
MYLQSFSLTQSTYLTRFASRAAQTTATACSIDPIDPIDPVDPFCHHLSAYPVCNAVSRHPRFVLHKRVFGGILRVAPRSARFLCTLISPLHTKKHIMALYPPSPAPPVAGSSSKNEKLICTSPLSILCYTLCAYTY